MDGEDAYFLLCLSKKLQEYLKSKLGIEPVGCCRIGHQRLTPDDTAIVVCNNCAAIMEESSNAGNIEFVWDIINKDREFPFPDYHGQKLLFSAE